MAEQVWHERVGDLVNQYRLTDNGLTVIRCGTGRRRVLEDNQRRRLSCVVPKSSWCEHALSIPEGDMQRLYSRYPELRCWDKDVRTRAWKRFLASSESRPYRVTDRRQ